MKGLFVTASNTNVGKTWIGSQLLAALKKRNISIQARKPVESGWPTTADISGTDAWKIADVMGEIAALDMICPNRFTAALSPDRAAMLEGTIITLKQLQRDCLRGIKELDFLYVEGAGGFYSPICHDGLNADLAVALELPVLLIVENRLGCINQALLNVEAIAKQGLNLSAIVLNQPSLNEADTAMDNFSDIQKRVSCDVIAFNYKQSPPDSIKQLTQAVIDIQTS